MASLLNDKLLSGDATMWSFGLVSLVIAVSTYVAFQRTATTNKEEKQPAAGGCPFARTFTDAQGNTHPALVQVPSLPIIGSYLTSFSKMPPVILNQVYDWRPMMRQKYGDFYTYGSPTIGVGLYKTIYSLTDPNEMNKVSTI